MTPILQFLGGQRLQSQFMSEFVETLSEVERNFLQVHISLCINSVGIQVPSAIPIHTAADVLH
jgi:hypothetical protein